MNSIVLAVTGASAQILAERSLDLLLKNDFDVLEFLINKIGNKKISMGSDYPFPLGESEPGSLIKNSNFSKEIKENLLYKNALDWLALKNTFNE